MVSVVAWLRKLEARAAGLVVAAGPLGAILTKGGQGRTPAEIARVAVAHVYWLLCHREPPAMTDEQVWEFLWRFRDRVFHPTSKEEA